MIVHNFSKKINIFMKPLEVIQTCFKTLPGQPTRKKAKTSEGHERPWHAMAVRFGRLKYISSIRVQPFQPAIYIFNPECN